MTRPSGPVPRLFWAVTLIAALVAPPDRLVSVPRRQMTRLAEPLTVVTRRVAGLLGRVTRRTP